MRRGRAWAATLVEPDLLGRPLVLRPPRACDVRYREALRSANESWLRPWDPSSPGAPEGHSAIEPLIAMARKSPASPYIADAHRRLQARQGVAFGWVICYGGQLAGELIVRQIAWGSSRSAELGYWVDDRGFAGRGIMPTALAMGVDHCFQVLGLHRLEAGIRPENIASRRVVEKLGFRDEGTRVRQVHIDGAWRDHICYAITTEDVPAGMLRRWRDALAASRSGA